MTTIPSIRIICDICQKDIEFNIQYYRIDTMIRNRATYHKERQMKHICNKCVPKEFFYMFDKIKVEK